MGIVTLEGIVERGQIQLKDGIRLPEHTRVYVIVPDSQVVREARIVSPRLLHPKQAADFQLEIIEEPSDAGL